MFPLIGFILVFGAVLGGFMEAGGPPAVLLQIAEFIVIGGAAIGSLLISAPGKVDRKSTRLNSSHIQKSRMPSSA